MQSSSRANSRKRVCRENSTGSDVTGQGLAPSRSGSLPASLAPYVPVPSAFGEPPTHPRCPCCLTALVLNGAFRCSIQVRLLRM